MNTLRHAIWMQQRGHSCCLLCVKDSALHKEALSTEIQLRLIRRNKKSFDLSNARRISRIVKDIQADLIWFRDKRDLSVLALAKRLSPKNTKLLYQQAMQLGVSKREFWHTVRFKQIDYWIAPLQYLAKQVREKTRFPAERMHVIPLAIDIAKFEANKPTKKEARSYFGLKEDDVVVGMIGRIDPHKAQAFVKRVVEQINAEGAKLKMLMVGSKTVGEWEEYYLELKGGAEASDQFLLYPFMEQVNYFYEAIDIFVMASKNETFGMVTIEAMLSGKKIAGTKSAGTRELIGENQERGYFFNWDDAASLRKAIKAILNDPQESIEKGTKARSYALENFSYQKACEQIEGLILRTKSH